MLRLESVGRSFGSLRALHDISFELNAGEVLALIGPNGAGKTTLVNQISGLDDGRQGRIWYKGREITGTSAYRRARSGIARTFQLVKLIEGLPILDNVMSGCYRNASSNLLAVSFGLGDVSSDEADMRATARRMLEFVGLGHIDGSAHIGTLTYGQQRLVEIARALAVKPDLLLLDEPAAGLNTAEAQALVGLIRQIRDTGIGILLIEHNMKLVADASDRCFVMHLGERLAEGTFEEISANPQVRKAYLGIGDGDA